MQFFPIFNCSLFFFFIMSNDNFCVCWKKVKNTQDEKKKERWWDFGCVSFLPFVCRNSKINESSSAACIINGWRQFFFFFFSFFLAPIFTGRAKDESKKDMKNKHNRHSSHLLAALSKEKFLFGFFHKLKMILPDGKKRRRFWVWNVLFGFVDYASRKEEKRFRFLWKNFTTRIINYPRSSRNVEKKKGKM